MARSKVTATGGAQGKRAALGTYWCNHVAYALFSDGYTRPAQQEELRGLPHLAEPFALAYVAAAQKSASEEAEAAAELARKARTKHFRVRWTEQYEQVREAETEEQACEERDDEDAFQECSELDAQEVRPCYSVDKTERVQCRNCEKCEGGWRPVKA